MTIGFWIEFILSAIVTAATYGAGPMLLAKLRKKPLSVWKLRLFCVAYTILVWVVWQFLTYDGNSVRTMPAMFWGYVFYRLARSAFEKKTTPAIPPDEQPEERWYTCSKCGQLVRDGEECDCEKPLPHPDGKLCGTPLVRKEQAPPEVAESEEAPAEAVASQVQAEKRKAVTPVLCVACVALVVCVCCLACKIAAGRKAMDALTAENAVLNENICDLETERDQLQAEVDALDARNEDLTEYLFDAIFLYDKIGFIVSGSNRYHSYNCPVFQGADEYWAHNIEYCEYLGYSKCGRCW